MFWFIFLSELWFSLQGCVSGVLCNTWLLFFCLLICALVCSYLGLLLFFGAFVVCIHWQMLHSHQFTQSHLLRYDSCVNPHARQSKKGKKYLYVYIHIYCIYMTISKEKLFFWFSSPVETKNIHQYYQFWLIYNMRWLEPIKPVVHNLLCGSANYTDC